MCIFFNSLKIKKREGFSPSPRTRTWLYMSLKTFYLYTEKIKLSNHTWQLGINFLFFKHKMMFCHFIFPFNFVGRLGNNLSFSKEQEMRIETDSDYYYDVLNIYERLISEIKKRFHSLEKGAVLIGKSRSYFYQSDIIGSVKKLNELCEKFDFDFDYILLGKNNTHHYTKRKINFNNLLKLYQEHRYKTRSTNTVKAIISMIRKGKSNIKLATLLMFADLYKTSPLNLI